MTKAVSNRDDIQDTIRVSEETKYLAEFITLMREAIYISYALI